MPEPALTPPLPLRDGRHQPGITSPAWPADAPAGIDAAIYAKQYAGQIDRQRHLHAVFADVTVTTRDELRTLLDRLTGFARHQMDKPPIQSERSLDGAVPNRRVSVAIGFGAPLFTTRRGDDRFGLAALKPSHLKILPRVDGDEDFDPADQVTDLVILIASDDLYVNEYVFGRIYYGGVHPGIAVRRVERGYARPDSREPSGFEDGLTNPHGGPPDFEMEGLVWVRPEDDEPAWCVDGTYLAYRKIRRRLGRFFKLGDPERAEVFGVERVSGTRLPGAAPCAHAPKINPRRPNHVDLFGMADTDRRFLRRPYFFNDGLDGDGEEVRGLHHMSFVRRLTDQYEWPVLMWQTNPDFPEPGTGGDDLYKIGGAANISGGYYFMPPAAPESGHVGAGLLD